MYGDACSPVQAPGWQGGPLAPGSFPCLSARQPWSGPQAHSPASSPQSASRNSWRDPCASLGYFPLPGRGPRQLCSGPSSPPPFSPAPARTPTPPCPASHATPQAGVLRRPPHSLCPQLPRGGEGPLGVRGPRRWCPGLRLPRRGHRGQRTPREPAAARRRAKPPAQPGRGVGRAAAGRGAHMLGGRRPGDGDGDARQRGEPGPAPRAAPEAAVPPARRAPVARRPEPPRRPPGEVTCGGPRRAGTVGWGAAPGGCLGG